MWQNEMIDGDRILTVTGLIPIAGGVGFPTKISDGQRTITDAGYESEAEAGYGSLGMSGLRPGSPGGIQMMMTL
jgi:hypothetical protein